MSTVVTVRVLDDQPVPEPVEGVVLQVYEAYGPFVTSGITDSSGEVEVLLPDADYDLRFYKQNVSILPRQPQRITVDALLVNVFQVTGHVRTLPETEDPKLCRISGYFYGPDGKPSRAGELGLSLVDEIVVSNANVILPLTQLLVGPDDAGYVEFDLLRGLRYDAYFIQLERLLGTSPPKHDVVVPDRASVALDKLLYPVPVLVGLTAEEVTVALADGSDSSVTVETTFSDGSIRAKATLWGNTGIVVEDESIVSAAVLNGVTLILRPLRSGITTLTFTRRLAEGMVLDPVPEFFSDTLVITVTF